MEVYASSSNSEAINCWAPSLYHTRTLPAFFWVCLNGQLITLADSLSNNMSIEHDKLPAFIFVLQQFTILEMYFFHLSLRVSVRVHTTTLRPWKKIGGGGDDATTWFECVNVIQCCPKIHCKLWQNCISTIIQISTCPEPQERTDAAFIISCDVG